MIAEFGHKLARDLVEDKKTNATKRFPAQLRQAARMKLFMLHSAVRIEDLRIPPGNRLEQLKGNLKGKWSIRINDQWRIVFRFENGNAYDVTVEDYHK
jgi:proteic killer suppression protein